LEHFRSSKNVASRRFTSNAPARVLGYLLNYMSGKGTDDEEHAPLYTYSYELVTPAHPGSLWESSTDTNPEHSCSPEPARRYLSGSRWSSPGRYPAHPHS